MSESVTLKSIACFKTDSLYLYRLSP